MPLRQPHRPPLRSPRLPDRARSPETTKSTLQEEPLPKERSLPLRHRFCQAFDFLLLIRERQKCVPARRRAARAKGARQMAREHAARHAPLARCLWRGAFGTLRHVKAYGTRRTALAQSHAANRHLNVRCRFRNAREVELRTQAGCATIGRIVCTGSFRLFTALTAYSPRKTKHFRKAPYARAARDM